MTSPLVASERSQRPLVAPWIAAIHPYEPGKPIEEVEREYGISDVVKLASNENPLGPSPRAVEAITRALAGTHRYPDGAAFSLRRKLAARFGVPETELVLGNGSHEIIDLLVRTFTLPGDEVLAPAHTFLCYRLSVEAHGATWREAARGPNLAYDVDALLGQVTPRTRLVFLASPDNPTGVHLGAAGMERLITALPPEVIFAVDEAYFEFVRTRDHLDLLEARRRRERMVVLRTFSKAYGLAGVRCGYALMPAEMASYVERVRLIFNVSVLAQAAAVAALDDEEHLGRTRAVNAAGMAQVTAGLDRLGVPWVPSEANFVLIDVSPRAGREVFEALLRRAVIVRPVGGYALPRHLRVSIGTEEENRRMLDALEAVLRG